MKQPILIELDSRRRTSLGKIGRHSRYLAREEPDGTLILEPAVVLTTTETALLGRPDLVAQMEKNVDQHGQERIHDHLEGCQLRRSYLYNLDEDVECTCLEIEAETGEHQFSE
jgi:hypothetical protein